MSSFPGSPRLLGGGIVLLDPDTSAVLRIITLQYNSDRLSRTLTPKSLKESTGRSRSAEQRQICERHSAGPGQEGSIAERAACAKGNSCS
jgi:hypothetical protein